MSDTNLAQLLRDQEVRPLKDRIRELEEQCLTLRAEVKRMQPLVRAANIYVDGITNKDSLLRTVGPLIDAVDNYQVALELTSGPSRS